MEPFVITKQVDRERGCIPACAISVLKHFGSLPAEWSESLLIGWMLYVDWIHGHQISGFHNLAEVLNSTIPNQCTVHIGHFDESHQFLLEHNNAGLPVLHAHVSPDGAHCVVLTNADESGVRLHDPWPDSPFERRVTYAELVSLGGGHQMSISPKGV